MEMRRKVIREHSESFMEDEILSFERSIMDNSIIDISANKQHGELCENVSAGSSYLHKGVRCSGKKSDI